MITDNLRLIESYYGDKKPHLIAVSKQQPDEIIEEALNAGLRTFGENKVQEALQRWEHRKKNYPDIKLHLIGPLQTNKVKQAIQLFDIIHTVDREKLALEIVKYKSDIPCFIQVNTGNEPQKSGIDVQSLEQFYQFCKHDLKMNIIGLMCIPPVDEPASLHFGLLANWSKRLKLKNLSMGMSDDFDKALQYGATHIRVGSKLFGARQ